MRPVASVGTAALRHTRSFPMKTHRLFLFLAAIAFATFGVTATASAQCETSCPYDGDGECDDGGPGSDTSVCELYDICEYGTDCGDCGVR
jgi:hypothetical protein